MVAVVVGSSPTASPIMKNDIDSIIEELKKERGCSYDKTFERNGNHVTPKDPNYLSEDWKAPHEMEEFSGLDVG